jgi:folate-binding protein YgfZ
MAEPARPRDGFWLPRETLLVRGPDRKTWLDGLVTCDVADLTPGLARYGLLLTKQGKIVTDLFLIDDGAQLFVGVAPGHQLEVQQLLDRYLVMEDAELELPSGAVTWRLFEAGSSPAAALARGGLKLGPAAFEALVSAEPSAADGGNSAELSALLAAHGLGVFGVDFDSRQNPHEASLDRIAVSWTKGCYLGQEVVCMQDMRGKVKRRLVPIRLARETALDPEEPVRLGAEGERVGRITSSALAETGLVVAFASVQTPHFEGGAELTVAGSPAEFVERTARG